MSKKKWLSTVIAAFLSLSGMTFAESAKSSWKSGRVISTGLHGYGNRANTKIAAIRSHEIWWSYCISSNERTYEVLSREKPAKTGLKENSSIKFLEQRSQIYVINPAGRRISLKIAKKGSGPTCP